MTETTEPPRLSQSIGKVLNNLGPFHAWHQHRQLGGLERHSDAMDRGTLIHELCLGGDKIEILDHTQWRTGVKRDKPAKQNYTSQDAKDAREAAREAGKVPVLQKEVAAVQPVVKRIRQVLDGLGVDRENPAWHFEERLQWEQDGVMCEGTPDIWGEHNGHLRVFDLKTLGRAIEPKKIGTTAATEWAIQRATYIFALEQLHPEWQGRVLFDWILAEAEPPHQVQVAEADWALRELGERQWMRAVAKWGHLLETQGWQEPWQPEDLELAAPGWALIQEEEAQADENTD